MTHYDKPYKNSSFRRILRDGLLAVGIMLGLFVLASSPQRNAQIAAFFIGAMVFTGLAAWAMRQLSALI